MRSLVLAALAILAVDASMDYQGADSAKCWSDIYGECGPLLLDHAGAQKYCLAKHPLPCAPAAAPKTKRSKACKKKTSGYTFGLSLTAPSKEQAAAWHKVLQQNETVVETFCGCIQAPLMCPDYVHSGKPIPEPYRPSSRPAQYSSLRHPYPAPSHDASHGQQSRAASASARPSFDHGGKFSSFARFTNTSAVTTASRSSTPRSSIAFSSATASSVGVVNSSSQTSRAGSSSLSSRSSSQPSSSMVSSSVGSVSSSSMANSMSSSRVSSTPSGSTATSSASSSNSFSSSSSSASRSSTLSSSSTVSSASPSSTYSSTFAASSSSMSSTASRSLSSSMSSSMSSSALPSSSPSSSASVTSFSSSILSSTTSSAASSSSSVVPLPCNFSGSQNSCSDPNGNFGSQQFGSVCGAKVVRDAFAETRFLFTTNPPEYTGCLEDCANNLYCTVWSFTRDAGGNTCTLYQGDGPYTTAFDSYSVRGYYLGDCPS